MKFWKMMGSTYNILDVHYPHWHVLIYGSLVRWKVIETKFLISILGKIQSQRVWSTKARPRWTRYYLESSILVQESNYLLQKCYLGYIFRTRIPCRGEWTPNSILGTIFFVNASRYLIEDLIYSYLNLLKLRNFSFH